VKLLGAMELDYLFRLVVESPTIYIDEMAEKLLSTYGVKASLPTICRALYHDLKLTRKQITRERTDLFVGLTNITTLYQDNTII